MKYQHEKYHDVIEELKPHLHEHYKEVAMYQDKIDFDPNYEAYGVAQDNGMLYIYTMRDEDELVGYNIFFVQTHPHYSSNMFAVNDIVYIAPNYRHKVDTLGFFAYCENSLKELGVDVMTYHMKVLKTFEMLMKTLEMDHAEHMYTKYIGK